MLVSTIFEKQDLLKCSNLHVVSFVLWSKVAKTVPKYFFFEKSKNSCLNGYSNLRCIHVSAFIKDEI